MKKILLIKGIPVGLLVNHWITGFRIKCRSFLLSLQRIKVQDLSQMDESIVTSYVLLDKMMRDNPALSFVLEVIQNPPEPTTYTLESISNSFQFHEQSVDFQYLILKLSVSINRFKVNANSLQESVAPAGEQSNSVAGEVTSSAEELVTQILRVSKCTIMREGSLVSTIQKDATLRD